MPISPNESLRGYLGACALVLSACTHGSSSGEFDAAGLGDAPPLLDAAAPADAHARERDGAATSFADASAMPEDAAPSDDGMHHPAGTYVALGSSFAAGPRIPSTIDDVCQRSDHNYAHLVASKLALALNDVSCAGATTENVWQASQGARVPQIQALGADTALITVTVGGNDVGYVTSVGLCAEAGKAGKRCLGSTVNVQDVEAQLSTVTDKLVRMLQALERAAPGARVLLASYPRILPDSAASCAREVPMNESDFAFVVSVGKRLNDAFVAAALRTNVELVDLYAESAGHEACAPPEVRWVEGADPASPAASFHPNARGMAAIADRIAQHWMR